jgi:hypothetical protein
MKTKFLLFLLFTVLLLPMPSFAMVFDFSFLGGVTSSGYQYDESLDVGVSRKAGFGVGALIATEVSRFVSLETGLLYLTHNFSVTQGGVTEDRKLDFVNLPVLLRFVPITPAAFYFGPYYGIETGSNSSDYGFLAGVGYRHILGPNVKLRIDGFYQYGLNNLDSNQRTQNSRNWFALAGIMIETW